MARVIACVIGLYIGILLVPALYLHRTVTPGLFVLLDDHHYSFVYGSALRMALGDHPDNVQINFGLISTPFVAFLDKSFTIDTFSAWIRPTQFFQLLIPLFTAILIWTLERKRWLSFFTLSIAAQWATTFHAG